jgi:hypothetical protein
LKPGIYDDEIDLIAGLTGPVTDFRKPSTKLDHYGKLPCRFGGSLVLSAGGMPVTRSTDELTLRLIARGVESFRD